MEIGNQIKVCDEHSAFSNKTTLSVLPTIDLHRLISKSQNHQNLGKKKAFQEAFLTLTKVRIFYERAKIGNTDIQIGKAC